MRVVRRRLTRSATGLDRELVLTLGEATVLVDCLQHAIRALDRLPSVRRIDAMAVADWCVRVDASECAEIPKPLVLAEFRCEKCRGLVGVRVHTDQVSGPFPCPRQGGACGGLLVPTYTHRRNAAP